MTDTYRIVVGHDLGATGDEALEQALTLAGRIAGAELEVLHVVPARERRAVSTNARLLDDALALLRARVARAVGGASVTARVHVRFGSPLEVLQQVAVDYDASLVVVGTGSRRGLDALSHRSVAARLVRIAKLPVLVAHAKDFSSLAATTLPDAPREGENLHRQQLVSERIGVPERTSHVSGLV